MDDDNKVAALPPGFRFCPTDEELVVHFLQRKASLLPCCPDVIPDLDLYPYDPWELQGRALEEGKQWYFFGRRIRQRVTANGYWKPMGTDEAVMRRRASAGGSDDGVRVGVKKYFVFHAGEAPAGVKTNWIMHEYRLCDTQTSSRPKPHRRLDYRKWVVCRVFEGNRDSMDDDDDDGTDLSCMDEVFLSLDDLDEVSLPRFDQISDQCVD